MKKVFAVVLVGLLVLPTLVFAKEQIRWYVGLGAGANESEIPVEEKVVADFNKSQDEIELVLEVVANSSAYDVLATQIAGGNVPDIVGPVGIRGRDSFKGAWLDLQPLVDKNSFDMSDFDASLVDFYRIEGEGLLGLPFGVFPAFIFVNKDLFDEAGLAYPPQTYGAPYVDADGNEKPWDMNTLRELAMFLTVDENGNDATSEEFDSEKIVQYGFGLQWTDARGLGTFFGPGSFVDANGDAQIPEAWIEGWKWAYKGMWEDFFIPNGITSGAEFLGAGNWFQSGNIGMVQCHLWYAGCCMGEYKGNWDTAVNPSFNGKTTAKLHADTFEITRGSKNPDAAFKVMTYLIGPAAEELLKLYGGMPARKSLQGTFFTRFGEEKFPGKQINWQVVVDSMLYSDNPSHEGWMPSYQETSTKYNEFWTVLANDGELDVDAEVAQLKSDLQVIFDAAKK